MHCNLSYRSPVVRVSEALAAESIRDETIESYCASLD